MYFKRRGIKISTGSISNLSFDFLLLIKQLHERNHGKVKKYYVENGGMIIHIDATDENGGNAVFQIKEGKSDITLFAASMISEKEEYILPILQQFKEHFGKPLAIVRDMGSAVVSSSDKVFPDVPNQICHYHFIRALGKKIFNTVYSDFRRAILNSKFTTNLHYLRKSVKEKLKKSSVMFYERHALYYLHLLIDHLLCPIKQRQDFPFQLSYKEFYDRTIVLFHTLLDHESSWGGSIIKIPQFSSFSKYLENFVTNRKIQALANKIDVLWDWFTAIRTTMRLMRNELNESRVLDLKEVKKMKDDLDQLLCRIESKGKELGDIYLRRTKMILNDFREKWDGLFIEVRDEDGNLIPIRRDNNIDEQAHRWIRMRIRRSTGKSRTQMEMYQLGALLAYFSNLYNQKYREIIFDGKSTIVDVFSNLDWQNLPTERRTLFFRNDGLDIPVIDKTRKELLSDYMNNVVEEGLPSDEYLDNWLSTMNGLVERWQFDFSDVDSLVDLM